jgi:2-methylcitrate dehydratase PrpD
MSWREPSSPSSTTLAAMIAGVEGESVQERTELHIGWDGHGEATALPAGTKLPMPHAALLNAVAGRSWDLDDVHEQNTCRVNITMCGRLWL